MEHLELASADRELFQVYSGARRPRILLAASGSVAAIKFANLCHCFSEWAEVKAVATKASLHFIDIASLPNDVTFYTDEDEWSTWKNIGDSVLHIELRRWADIMVIAPLSANTLGKIAGGLCDNLLTCIVRAWDYSKPFFVAPAMNTLMWNNPFTERHLMTIDDLGISLIPPVTKRLACGDNGNGAMAEPSLIFSTDADARHLYNKYKHKRMVSKLDAFTWMGSVGAARRLGLHLEELWMRAERLFSYMSRLRVARKSSSLSVREPSRLL
ncbi:unnamed protein product [Fraxinus pennsylvanica]|uniref:phosphopantothenoylcysteine decarboxylase n=1 Tax=Fraxinus pennsylvanica TaxID=56036 RepID=A0AAD2E7S2_9LAMI|nr:unnamed protein product [Fraxinus pennsylvanica]